MIRQFTFIAVVVLLASMAAPPARGQCDEFTGTTLGPEWFVRAGVGSYSLTERPGFLRYTLGSWGHWNVCAHPEYVRALELSRPFAGTEWEIVVKVEYHLPYGMGRALEIGIGYANNWGAECAEWADRCVLFERHRDDGYGSNYMQTKPGNVRVPLNTEDVYFLKIVRSGNNFTLSVSSDGTTYTTVSVESLAGDLSAYEQGLVISGYQYDGGLGYMDIDLVCFPGVTPPPPPTPLEALIDIAPDTLNLKSHGQYVTCYITLPEGVSPSDILPSSVKIVAVSGDPIEPGLSIDPSFAPEVGDYDEDGISDLTVKFDRQELILAPLLIGDREIRISGNLADGREFGGADPIRVIDRGK